MRVPAHIPPQSDGAGPSPARILFAEDDHPLREAITEYLVRSDFAVTAVGTGLAFYHALAEQRYSVAIIDLGLPDVDGLSLVKYVHQNTTMRCIVLTARDAVESRIAGYDSGADLYMVKPVDSRELASALSRMIRRETAMGTEKAPTASWQLNRPSATLLTPSASVVPLTSREMEFLLCLARAPEKAIQRDAILTAMKYADDELANRALESLVRRLRRKIERQCSFSPIQTCYGVGYSFSAPLILL